MKPAPVYEPKGPVYEPKVPAVVKPAASGGDGPHDILTASAKSYVDTTGKEDSSGSAYAKASAAPDVVSVWGKGESSGDGKSGFQAEANSKPTEGGDGLHADVWGASGKGVADNALAKVKCNTLSPEEAEGDALCDGEAIHH